MKIDVLFFEGCPHHAPTLALVREVAGELGIEGTITEVEVATAEDASALRFLGSPTVQVDGVDIDPDGRVRTTYSMSCRMYGASGIPPREMIRSALRAGAA